MIGVRALRAWLSLGLACASAPIGAAAAADLAQSVAPKPGARLLLAADDATVAAPRPEGKAEERQTEVARRGAEVMPFSLAATQHIFTNTATGGVQRVVARDGADEHQIQLVREHLRDMQARFQRGDFSGPDHIHGHDMPGLAQLAAAKPGQLVVAYREVDGGAELVYRPRDPGLIAALHAWFEAQLADHGADAMAGHHPSDAGSMAH
jgi:hypothetical protein